MPLYQRGREVQQRRIERQYLLQVYRKVAAVVLPQAVVVGLVQTEVVPHIPGKKGVRKEQYVD